MGHRDTVFPDGEAERRPFTIRDGVAYGPGVADMKAGLVMNCFVLAAFAKFGGSPAPMLGLFTGDEEIGSPEGRAVIEAEARRARVVFNSTGPRVGQCGDRAQGRRVHGVPHQPAGGAFRRQFHRGHQRDRGTRAQGPGAACGHRLDRGITVNVGLIKRGQSVNTVAPWAEGEIDLRYIDPPDREDAMARIGAIIEHSHLPGTKAELTIRATSCRWCKAHRETSVRIYVQSAADTGFTTAGEFTGGCAHLGFTAASAPRRSAESARSAAMRTARTNSCASTAWCRAHRPVRGRSCGWNRPGKAPGWRRTRGGVRRRREI